MEARPQLWPQHFGTAGWLLTVILFVLTLTSFEWKDIGIGGVAALGLIIARLVGKLVGVLAFAKPSGLNWKQGVALGLSLSPMSALAYLLVDDTYTLYPNLDPSLRAIMMCSIVVLQIVGPWLVYRCLALVGERRESKQRDRCDTIRRALRAFIAAHSTLKTAGQCKACPADLNQGTPCHSNPSSIRNRSPSVSNSRCRSSIPMTMI